jgi:hypothetical protein
MTVHFQMEGVDVGPRIAWSTMAAWAALHTLGYQTDGKGCSGDALDAADLVSRSRRILRPMRAKVVTLKALPDGFEITTEEQVLLCIVDIVELAEKALAAGRLAIRYLP